MSNQDELLVLCPRFFSLREEAVKRMVPADRLYAIWQAGKKDETVALNNLHLWLEGEPVSVRTQFLLSLKRALGLS
jgi:hypothetical protein